MEAAKQFEQALNQAIRDWKEPKTSPPFYVRVEALPTGREWHVTLIPGTQTQVYYLVFPVPVKPKPFTVTDMNLDRLAERKYGVPLNALRMTVNQRIVQFPLSLDELAGGGFLPDDANERYQESVNRYADQVGMVARELMHAWDNAFEKQHALVLPTVFNPSEVRALKAFEAQNVVKVDVRRGNTLYDTYEVLMQIGLVTMRPDDFSDFYWVSCTQFGRQVLRQMTTKA